MKLKQIRVDGYKNLINCAVDLGDFNVLVGPNNSGKSNLLEAIQMLFCFCLADEKVRDMAFKGFAIRNWGTSVSHLKAFDGKPLSIGVTFETTFRNHVWITDYDFTVSRESRPGHKAQFLKETLRAKPSSRTGVPTTYICRDSTHLKIKGKRKRTIATDVPTFLAIRTIYPKFDGLPAELKKFIDGMMAIALTDILLMSPEMLRDAMGRRTSPEGFRISSFDLLATIDEIRQENRTYELFRETLVDILDVENLKFVAKDIPAPSDARHEKPASERVMYCYLKKRGDTYAHIAEYSDGTLAVVAILAALFSRRFGIPVLCVEELENCLHPSAIQRLLRFLQDNSPQWPVLITTHSPYVLNCVNPEDVNVALVDETGATHFEKVRNTKQLRDYLKSGLMSFGDMLPSNFADVLGK